MQNLETKTAIKSATKTSIKSDPESETRSERKRIIVLHNNSYYLLLTTEFIPRRQKLNAQRVIGLLNRKQAVIKAKRNATSDLYKGTWLEYPSKLPMRALKYGGIILSNTISITSTELSTEFDKYINLAENPPTFNPALKTPVKITATKPLSRVIVGSKLTKDVTVSKRKEDSHVIVGTIVTPEPIAEIPLIINPPVTDPMVEIQSIDEIPEFIAEVIPEVEPETPVKGNTVTWDEFLILMCGDKNVSDSQFRGMYTAFLWMRQL